MFEMDFRFLSPNKNKPLHIVVEVDGATVIFSDGVLYSDNQKLIDEIAMASFSEQSVRLTPTGPTVSAGLNGKPINVFAALVSSNPDKWFIKEAPKSVMRYIYPAGKDSIY